MLATELDGIRAGIFSTALSALLAEDQFCALIERYQNPPGQGGTNVIRAALAVCGLWAHKGFISVEMPDTYAASLMTSAGPTDSVTMPWDAFEIVLPPGLLACSQVGRCASVLVARNSAEDAIVCLGLCDDGKIGRVVTILAADFTALAFHTTTSERRDLSVSLKLQFGSEGPHAPRLGPPDAGTWRMVALLGRLAAATCHELATHHQALLGQEYGLTWGQVRPNVVRIGYPVADVRPVVREYLRGAYAGRAN